MVVGTCSEGHIDLRGSSNNDKEELVSFCDEGYHYGVKTSVEGPT
jgi:hypothetical protein